MTPVLVRKSRATLLDLPDRKAREFASSALGSQSTTLRIVEIEARPSERGPHVHRGFEEVIHVLAGEGQLVTPSTRIALRSCDSVIVPSGVFHMTENTGKETLVLICAFPVADIAEGTEEVESWQHV